MQRLKPKHWQMGRLWQAQSLCSAASLHTGFHPAQMVSGPQMQETMQAAMQAAMQKAITPSVVNALIQQGYAVVDNIFGGMASRLREEVVALYCQDRMHLNSTHLVRGGATALLPKQHIREAELTLDPAVQRLAPLCNYLNKDRTLATMVSLHSQLLLDSQAIKLQYNAGRGGCFPVHLDSDPSVDTRMVTCIFYLNPGPVNIAPKNDRLVLFSSQRMLHRVLPFHISSSTDAHAASSSSPAAHQPLHLNSSEPATATKSETSQAEHQGRACFTIWLSQSQARRRGRPEGGLRVGPPLSATQPQASPDEDPVAAAGFLMSPSVRPHAMRLAYAEEWRTSLIESHPPGPELDTMLSNNDQEVRCNSVLLHMWVCLGTMGLSLYVKARKSRLSSSVHQGALLFFPARGKEVRCDTGLCTLPDKMMGSTAPLVGSALMRAFTSSSVAAAAVPAVVSKSSSGPGLASMFGFGSSRIDTPLSEPLPSNVSPLRSHIPTVAPKLQTGALDAGTKVAAIDSCSPISAVALVFEGGSAFETAGKAGISRVLESVAFKATANRSTFRLTRELEKIGALATCAVGRDHIAYTVSAVKLHAPEIVEALLDATLNPKLQYHEVAESVAATQAHLAAALSNPAVMLQDVLHRAAFDGSLGQPMNVDPEMLEGVDNRALKEYIASVLKPGSAVLAAAGVGLDEFKQLANPLVSSEGPSGPGLASSSTYLGGSLNLVANASPLAYVGLGFEVKGGLSDPKAAAAAAVVRALLDESRSVLPRLNKEGELLHSATGFSHLYKSTGLVGLLASSAPAQAAQLADAVVKKVETLAKGVPEAQLRQAKQVAISAYKAQLSSSVGLVSVLGQQILLTGKFNPAEFPAAVEALTTADVSSFMSKALKSAPTYVTYGSLSAARVPRYDAIAQRF